MKESEKLNFSLFSLNVSKAFNNVLYYRLLHKMKEKNLLKKLVK